MVWFSGEGEIDSNSSLVVAAVMGLCSSWISCRSSLAWQLLGMTGGLLPRIALLALSLGRCAAVVRGICVRVPRLLLLLFLPPFLWLLPLLLLLYLPF